MGNEQELSQWKQEIRQCAPTHGKHSSRWFWLCFIQGQLSTKSLSYKECEVTQLASAILRLEHFLQVTDNLWHNSEVISELLNPRVMHIRFESDAFELLAWFRFCRAWYVRVHSNTYWLRQRRDFTQTYPRNKLKRTWERLNHIYSFKR